MGRTVSFDDFYTSLDREDLDDYIFHKETYNGATKKMDITHKKCGKTFSMIPKSFRSGHSCTYCAQNKRNAALIKQIPEKEMDKINSNGLELVEYNGYSNVNKFKHTCGHIMRMTVKTAKSFKTCPKCGILKVAKPNKNYDKYNKIMKESHYCEILPDYFSSTIKPAVFKCTLCGDIFIGYYNNMVINNIQGCQNCRTYAHKDLNYYKDKLKEKHLDKEYEFIDETFKNSVTPMKIKHLTCGKIFEKTLTDFFSNNQHCPVCVEDTRILTNEEVKQRFLDKGFEMLETYQNSYTPVKVKCTKCGAISTKYPGSMKTLICPCNNMTLGESMIAKCLTDMNIEFCQQKTFPNLEYCMSLRCDFYIPSLNLVIEYDGIQHFQPVEAFGGLKSFEDTQIRDKIKNEYMKKHGINILRIPYTEINNIEQILKTRIE